MKYTSQFLPSKFRSVPFRWLAMIRKLYYEQIYLFIYLIQCVWSGLERTDVVFVESTHWSFPCSQFPPLSVPLRRLIFLQNYFHKLASSDKLAKCFAKF